MKRTLNVFLGNGDRRVGTLHYDRNGAREHAAFAYDETWLAAENRFAIEPNLPLVAGPQFHRKAPEGSVFHAAIADPEPDGWARRLIVRDHAKRRQAARRAGKDAGSSQVNAVDFLLAVDDGSRVGALRFRDEEGVFQRAAEADRRTTPPLMELRHLISASRAVETETETAADLAYLRGRGTSLGGLRPKCTVVDDDGMLAIGKFPSVQDERSVTKGEVGVDRSRPGGDHRGVDVGHSLFSGLTEPGEDDPWPSGARRRGLAQSGSSIGHNGSRPREFCRRL